jgi:hypothetical protein
MSFKLKSSSEIKIYDKKKKKFFSLSRTKKKEIFLYKKDFLLSTKKKERFLDQNIIFLLFFLHRIKILRKISNANDFFSYNQKK